MVKISKLVQINHYGALNKKNTYSSNDNYSEDETIKGIRRLHAAILIGGIKDYLSLGNMSGPARYWIMEKGDYSEGDEYISFEEACHTVRINPDRLRSILLKLEEFGEEEKIEAGKRLKSLSNGSLAELVSSL